MSLRLQKPYRSNGREKSNGSSLDSDREIVGFLDVIQSQSSQIFFTGGRIWKLQSKIWTDTRNIDEWLWNAFDTERVLEKQKEFLIERIDGIFRSFWISRILKILFGSSIVIQDVIDSSYFTLYGFYNLFIILSRILYETSDFMRLLSMTFILVYWCNKKEILSRSFRKCSILISL